MGTMLKVDFNSPEWAALEDWIKVRLAETLSVLKNPNVGHEQTQLTRGQILVLEELLSLPTSMNVPLGEIQIPY